MNSRVYTQKSLTPEQMVFEGNNGMVLMRRLTNFPREDEAAYRLAVARFKYISFHIDDTAYSIKGTVLPTHMSLWCELPLPNLEAFWQFLGKRLRFPNLNKYKY